MAIPEGRSVIIPVPEDASDYVPGKADMVTEMQDEKGKYWLSKPVIMKSDGSVEEMPMVGN